eukprot:3648105-Pyramimonas_sp.AAC.1
MPVSVMTPTSFVVPATARANAMPKSTSGPSPALTQLGPAPIGAANWCCFVPVVPTKEVVVARHVVSDPSKSTQVTLFDREPLALACAELSVVRNNLKLRTQTDESQVRTQHHPEPSGPLARLCCDWPGCS